MNSVSQDEFRCRICDKPAVIKIAFPEFAPRSVPFCKRCGLRLGKRCTAEYLDKLTYIDIRHPIIT